MPPFVKVLGLQRAGARIGGQRLSSKAAITIDLGDSKTRQDFAHHAAIGQCISLGDVAPAAGGATVVVSGGVVTPTASTTARGLDVTAGSTRTTGGTVQAFSATTVTFGAAHASLQRIDIVQVNEGTGAVSVKAGTAAANPSVPSADASNVALAAVYVPANATAPKWINDIRPLAAV